MNAENKLIVTQDGFLKTIVFNQPHKKNPVDLSMGRAFMQALVESEKDGTRVIVLKGAGNNFGTGADLDPAALDDGRAANVAKYLKEEVNPIVLKLRSLDIPIIALVRGACVGVSFNFALACDMIFATPDARFSQIFTRIGLSSDGGGSYFMPFLVGYRKAFELMTSGNVINAAEAERMGLINRIVPEPDIEAFVTEAALKLANGPFLAITNTKRNLNAGIERGLEAALNAEADNQMRTINSADFTEGVFAFLQKRKPEFKGK